MPRVTKAATPSRPVTRQKTQECFITDMSLEQRLKRKRRARVFAGDEERQPCKKAKQPKQNTAASATKLATSEVLVGYRLRKRVRDAVDACSASWPSGELKFCILFVGQ